MYSDRELNRLSAHKAALRARIAFRRVHCAALAGRITRPLAWLDRAVALWRRLSPFTQLAAVPLGFLVTRALTPRLKVLGALARWGPLAFATMRGLGTFLKSRDGPARP
jgi:hypothetical protein